MAPDVRDRSVESNGALKGDTVFLRTTEAVSVDDVCVSVRGSGRHVTDERLTAQETWFAGLPTRKLHFAIFNSASRSSRSKTPNEATVLQSSTRPTVRRDSRRIHVIRRSRLSSGDCNRTLRGIVRLRTAQLRCCRAGVLDRRTRHPVGYYYRSNTTGNETALFER